MRAVVIYESMYGNTHQIARAIGGGLGAGDIVVVPVDQVDDALVGAADLVVVGGPTHVHGMTRPKTREAAAEAARKPGSRLVLDPSATGPGVRDLLESIDGTGIRAAAYDTRMHGPAIFTGRASKGIARMLRRAGFELIARPESFRVTKDSHLDAGEEARARQWGSHLASVVAAAPRATPASA